MGWGVVKLGTQPRPLSWLGGRGHERWVHSHFPRTCSVAPLAHGTCARRLHMVAHSSHNCPPPPSSPLPAYTHHRLVPLPPPKCVAWPGLSSSLGGAILFIWLCSTKLTLCIFAQCSIAFSSPHLLFPPSLPPWRPCYPQVRRMALNCLHH